MDIKNKYTHLFEYSNLKSTCLPPDAIEKAKKLLTDFRKQHEKKKSIARSRNYRNN